MASGFDRPKPSRADNGTVEHRPIKIAVDHLSFFYGHTKALQDISLEIQANVVTAFIGPSGCGKSTFLRTLNRMNDVIPGTRVEGRVSIERILDRLADITIDEDKHGPAASRAYNYEPTFILRGLTDINIKFTPVA